MPSSPLGSTCGRMTSGVTCHLCPWTTHTVGRLRRGLPSTLFDNIYGWRTSGEACHHGLCLENTVEQRRAWKAIIALEQHRQGQITSGMAYHYSPWRTYTVEQCRARHVIIALGLHTWSNVVGHDNAIIFLGHHTQLGIKSHHCLFDSTDGRITSTWHNIFSFGLHTRTNDIGRGMRSLPLCCIHNRMKSSVACHHDS